MEVSISNSIGFSVLKNQELEDSIRQIENPVSDKTGVEKIFADKDERRLALLVKRAEIAYSVDGLVRQAVDKYSENFKDFSFRSDNPRALKYLDTRLSQMSLLTNEPWRITFTRVIHEYWKTGNSFFIKVRGDNNLAIRPLYKDKPIPLIGIFLVSASRLEPTVDEKTKIMAWKFSDYSNKEKLDLVQPGAKRLPDKMALLEGMNVSEAELLKPGSEIVQVAYKKAPDSNWGIGVTLAALEDVVLLRSLEQTTAVMIKKNSNPIIHHKVLRAHNVTSGIQSEINKTATVHRQSAPEGIIVTGPQHEIKAIGSESQALRVGEYLDHYTRRALAGLGVNASLVGFDPPGTQQAAEAAWEIILTKVRFCEREIAESLETSLINEILYEGGFDPYKNPKDRVRIVFEEIDQSRQLKLRSSYADLYTKNFMDLLEARKEAGITDPVNEAFLYTNKVTIPELKSTEETKLKVAKISKANRPAVKSSVVDFNFSETLADLIEMADEIPDTVYKYLKNTTDLSFTTLRKVKKQLSQLVADKEACLLLVLSEVTNDENFRNSQLDC